MVSFLLFLFSFFCSFTYGLPSQAATCFAHPSELDLMQHTLSNGTFATLWSISSLSDFVIEVLNLPSYYEPNAIVQIRIRNTEEETGYRGLLLYAQDANGTQIAGFTNLNEDSTQFHPLCNSAITHVFSSLGNDLFAYNETFDYILPDIGFGENITFYGIIYQTNTGIADGIFHFLAPVTISRPAVSPTTAPTDTISVTIVNQNSNPIDNDTLSIILNFSLTTNLESFGDFVNYSNFSAVDSLTDYYLSLDSTGTFMVASIIDSYSYVMTTYNLSFDFHYLESIKVGFTLEMTTAETNETSVTGYEFMVKILFAIQSAIMNSSDNTDQSLLLLYNILEDNMTSTNFRNEFISQLGMDNNPVTALIVTDAIVNTPDGQIIDIESYIFKEYVNITIGGGGGGGGKSNDLSGEIAAIVICVVLIVFVCISISIYSKRNKRLKLPVPSDDEITEQSIDENDVETVHLTQKTEEEAF